MEAIEAIFSRRSIRKYHSRALSAGQIETLLKAAMSAPSAGNQQPWHFVVIQERRVLNEIPKIHPYAKMLEEAPVGMLVCGDLNLERYQHYWMLDCSAATENLLLSANALGLGAVWLGVYPVEERITKFRALLALPENIIPFSLIAVGYAAEEKPPANRFDTNRVHWERW
jgi:nitroreductase